MDPKLEAKNIALSNRVCDYATGYGKESKPCLKMADKAFQVGSTLYAYCNRCLAILNK